VEHFYCIMRSLQARPPKLFLLKKKTEATWPVPKEANQNLFLVGFRVFHDS
jgi:hypothetical protein